MSIFKDKKEELKPKPLNPRDLYYECITSCSIGDDGMQCITQCIEVHLKKEAEK